jgi:hypothetical protein
MQSLKKEGKHAIRGENVGRNAIVPFIWYINQVWHLELFIWTRENESCYPSACCIVVRGWCLPVPDHVSHQTRIELLAPTTGTDDPWTLGGP